MKLKIGNTEAIILDEKISMVKRSPLFFLEENSGSYIFTFSIFASVEIKKELGYSNRPGSSLKSYKREAILQDTSLYFKGTATLQEINEEKLTVYLPIYNSSLQKILEKIKLPELPLPKEIRTYQTMLELRRWGQPISHYNFLVSSRKTFGPLHFIEATSSHPNLWQNHNTFVSNTNAIFTVFVNIDIEIKQGLDFMLEVHKNNAPFISESLSFKPHPLFSLVNWSYPHRPYFTKTGSRMLELTFSLQMGETLTFFLSAAPQASGGAFGAIEFRVCAGTTIGIYNKNLLEENCEKTWPETPYAIFPIYNPKFYSEAPTTRFKVGEKSLRQLNEKIPVINYHENNRFPRSITRTHDNEIYSISNTTVPFVFLPEIIKTIFEKTDITIIGANPFEKTSLKKAVIVGTKAINILTEGGIGALPYKFNLADCVPNITCSDFLTKICRTLGIVYNYNSSDTTIQFYTLGDIVKSRNSIDISENIIEGLRFEISSIKGFKIEYQSPECEYFKQNTRPLSEVNLKGTVANQTALPELNNKLNDAYYVTSEKAYYYYFWDDQTERLAWVFFAGKMILAISEIDEDYDSQMELTLPIAPVIDYHGNLDPTYEMTFRILKLPAMETAGWVEGMKPTENEEYRLAFYSGMVYDGTGRPYPRGTSEIPTNILNQPLPGHIDLGMGPVNSLYTETLKEYADFTGNTEGVYTLSKILDKKELQNLSFTQWYTINGQDYLIKEIRAEITTALKVLAEIQIVKRVLNTAN